MTYIIALLALSTSQGLPDLVLPVSDETFDSIAVCQLRREVLIERHGLEENQMILCLDRNVFPADLPQ